MGKFQVKMSQRHEREIEELWPQAKRTIASGAKFEKGDLKTEEVYSITFAVECKSTQNSSYSVSEKVWNLIKEHAQSRSYTARPVLAVRLYGPTEEKTSWGVRENTPETVPVHLDLVTLELNDFLEFYEDYLRLKEKEANELS